MKRNKFSLSHYKLLTCDMGKLVPLTWYEALPGDTIQQASSALVRVSPLVAPVMHPVRVRIHHFFVPYRLIWSDWEDFITGGPDGDDASVPPYRTSSGITAGTLFDYLGVPVGSYSPNLQFSALPLRAYQLIWNEYYRDQDLQTEADVGKASGADGSTTTIQSVCWEKDYFTSARDSEQKGTEVTIPIGDTADVVRKSNAAYWKAYQTGTDTLEGTGDITVSTGNVTGPSGGISFDPMSGLEADLTAATGVNISDLRLALALQRYMEARSRYGSRYVEYLRYLGVRSSDARMQKPEYLGGGRQIIQFSEVLDVGKTTIGAMAGHGIAAMRTARFRRYFEEHGIVMSLLSVVPKSMYHQGLWRFFSRTVKEDWFQKELAFIGDQAVRCDEIYANAADRDGVFGYQGRYDEYRSIPSFIHADFHTNLDEWHMARDFGSEPTLNSTFVACAPTTRIYASTTYDPLYIMSNHSIQARRMIPKRPVSKTF